MCNEISKRSGRKCKLQPTEKFCFVHKAQIAKKQFETNSLLADYTKDEVRNLNKTIQKQSIKIRDLWNKLASMQTSYEKYEKIKYFETLKKNLHQFVDVYDLDKLYFFCLQDKNKKTLIDILGDHEDHYMYYNQLRWQRNKLCHFDI